MELRVSRIDKSLPMPEYQTPGACAFDLYARETTVIPPHAVVLIPSNLVVCVPQGHVLLVSSRSSTARKRGLLIPLGVIDQDYCGPEDEVKIQTLNFTDAPVTIERGDRFAQALVMPIERCALAEAAPSADPAKNRGGFGSTG